MIEITLDKGSRKLYRVGNNLNKLIMVFSKNFVTTFFVGGALALSFSIATAQTYFCETVEGRSNGFCRNSDLGNPLCYTSGSGTACSGSGYEEEVVE